MSEQNDEQMAPETASSSHVSPETLAEAVERRTRALPPQPSAAEMARQRERQLLFRRMIDPGIIRPNSKEQAFASLKTLLTISENILREPENPKYHQFKPTNTIIKRNLVEPKGTLEYAIELGFRPEVDNFQPYYSWNPRRLEDLKIGTAILKETINLEAEKQARLKVGKESEKEARLAAANRVKLAFMDDRKSKMDHDRREKERREAHAVAMAAARERAVVESPSPEPTANMPGSGHILGAPAGASSEPMPISDDED